MIAERKKVKEGDIWNLGSHRIGCGSALDSEFIKLVMGGGQNTAGAHGSSLRSGLRRKQSAFQRNDRGEFIEYDRDKRGSMPNGRRILEIYERMDRSHRAIFGKLQFFLCFQFGRHAVLVENGNEGSRSLLQSDDYLDKKQSCSGPERLFAPARISRLWMARKASHGKIEKEKRFFLSETKKVKTPSDHEAGGAFEKINTGQHENWRMGIRPVRRIGKHAHRLGAYGAEMRHGRARSGVCGYDHSAVGNVDWKTS